MVALLPFSSSSDKKHFSSPLFFLFWSQQEILRPSTKDQEGGGRAEEGAEASTL